MSHFNWCFHWIRRYEFEHEAYCSIKGLQHTDCLSVYCTAPFIQASFILTESAAKPCAEDTDWCNWRSHGWSAICEPRHDKTNKVSVRPAKTQISMGIRPVWTETSLSAWRKLGSLATHWAHNEDSDQTGRMPRLIWVIAGRRVILLVLSCRCSCGCGTPCVFSQTLEVDIGH